MTEPPGEVAAPAPVTYMAGTVLLPEAELRPGWFTVAGDRIVGVGAGRRAPPAPGGAPMEAVDLGDVIVTPGFIDLHNHGGGGAESARGPDAARTAVAAHRAHGTTSVVASLLTDRLDALEDQVRALAPLVASGELAGLHLEGPWLSSRYCGAHPPELMRDPRVEDIDRLLDAGAGAVRIVTLAVELAGGIDAARHVVSRGVVAAAGHSDATYAAGCAAVEAGVTLATHLYNAARVPHHREPGLVLALLESERVAVELIADGVHLHPAVLREAVRRAPGRSALVTDAMAAASAGDGDYRLGTRDVVVRDGVARLAGESTIAGSTLTLDRAVRHAVTEAGVPLGDAVTAATATPARVLGRDDLGRIAPGCRADVVVLDQYLRVRRVLASGAWLEPTA